MRIRVGWLGSAVLLAVCSLHAWSAELPKVRLHFVSQDAVAERNFWKTIGARPAADVPGALEFPGALFIVEHGTPSGGTVGSIVNHIGFVVPNVQKSLAAWKSAGLKAEPGHSDQQCFLSSPDGLVRIEVLQDPTLTVPIAFQHIHFFTANRPGQTGSALENMRAWYVRTFGASPRMRGKYESADFDGVNLTFTNSDTPVAPTTGRAIDFLGFDVKNLNAFCRKEIADGQKFDKPCRENPRSGVVEATMTDPWGTRLQLRDEAAH